MKNTSLMKVNTLLVIFCLLGLFACKQNDHKDTTLATAVEVPKELSMEEQLKEIMNIWPGIYNNKKQVQSIEAAGGDIWKLDDSGEGGFLELTSHYRKADLPELGDHVLYVEEYRDNQPDSTYRQRIYTLDIDAETKQIKVKLWPFKDKKKYIGAWKTPDMIKQIELDEVSAYPSKCDLIVERQDGKYHMYMNGKDCAFGDKVFNYEVLLGKDMFSFRDKISTLSTGELVSTAGNFEYHHLDRVE